MKRYAKSAFIAWRTNLAMQNLQCSGHKHHTFFKSKCRTRNLFKTFVRIQLYVLTSLSSSAMCLTLFRCIVASWFPLNPISDSFWKSWITLWFTLLWKISMACTLTGLSMTAKATWFSSMICRVFSWKKTRPLWALLAILNRVPTSIRMHFKNSFFKSKSNFKESTVLQPRTLIASSVLFGTIRRRLKSQSLRIACE